MEYERGSTAETVDTLTNLCCTLVCDCRQAWDLALDLCLSQLSQILADGRSFQHSPFFAEQLTAFQVWLNYGSEKRSPPEQLPIVLQVRWDIYD